MVGQHEVDGSWLTVVPIAALLLFYGCPTPQAVAVWQSELTLWAHAADVAPEKPSVANNYGVALVQAGRLREARAQFQRAAFLANPYRMREVKIKGQPTQFVVEPLASHTPAWDRREAAEHAAGNLDALTRLEARIQ